MVPGYFLMPAYEASPERNSEPQNFEGWFRFAQFQSEPYGDTRPILLFFRAA
jgi:hypothetical protein